MNWALLIVFVLFCLAVGGYVYLAEYRGARMDAEEQASAAAASRMDGEP